MNGSFSEETSCCNTSVYNYYHLAAFFLIPLLHVYALLSSAYFFIIAFCRRASICSWSTYRIWRGRVRYFMLSNISLSDFKMIIGISCTRFGSIASIMACLFNGSPLYEFNVCYVPRYQGTKKCSGLWCGALWFLCTTCIVQIICGQNVDMCRIANCYNAYEWGKPCAWV